MKARIEEFIFSNRKLIIVFFVLMTLVMLWQASNLKIDAGFAKLLPLKHEYMKT